MEADDTKAIQIYENLYSQYGKSFRSLDWGSQESQHRRFQVLAEIGIAEGDNILDIGCGFADFYSWLQQNRCNVIYQGIDITPAMILSAREIYPSLPLEISSLKNYNLKEKSYIALIRENGSFKFKGKTWKGELYLLYY